MLVKVLLVCSRCYKISYRIISATCRLTAGETRISSTSRTQQGPISWKVLGQMLVPCLTDANLSAANGNTQRSSKKIFAALTDNMAALQSAASSELTGPLTSGVARHGFCRSGMKIRKRRDHLRPLAYRLRLT